MTMVTAYPTSVTQTGALTAWSTPANAQGAPDAVNTTCSGLGASRTLVCNTFGFAVPTDATISGFVVTPVGNVSGDPTTYTVNIFEGGGSSLGGGTAADVAVFGTSSNGRGLTPANINNLKVTLVWSSNGEASDVAIDAVKVDVYYTEASSGTTTETGRTRGRAFGRAR